MLSAEGPQAARQKKKKKAGDKKIASPRKQELEYSENNDGLIDVSKIEGVRMERGGRKWEESFRRKDHLRPDHGVTGLG